MGIFVIEGTHTKEVVIVDIDKHPLTMQLMNYSVNIMN